LDLGKGKGALLLLAKRALEWGKGDEEVVIRKEKLLVIRKIEVEALIVLHYYTTTPSRNHLTT
jgi:hypothetical protein